MKTLLVMLDQHVVRVSDGVTLVGHLDDDGLLQAVELEKAYNEDMLPKGILGLNADYVNQYVMHMTDRRLQELGFDPEYNVPNPAKWMATANDTLELVNFFESTNTSYEVNSGK